LRDSPPLGVEHLDAEAVDLEMLAHGRHASDAGEEITADRLEPFAFDVDVELLRDGVDVDFAAEHETAVAFVDHRVGLAVVLVAYLADDLLEQIFECHQPGGAAVLVDDNRALRLLNLELPEQ